MRGPYLGQKPPGMTPVLFASEILTSYKPNYSFCSVFSPDGNEFYFCTGDKTCDIVCMKRVDNRWTQPETVSFNSQYNDIDMRISVDGFRIFFQSWRPLPGSSVPDSHGLLWFSVRTKRGWREPQPVKCADTILRAGYPDISSRGTLYFSMRDMNTGNVDIHCSRFINGSYGPPENLGNSINTDYVEGDLCVSPDESFIIVSCWDRPDNIGGAEGDLYVSFRKEDGSWTKLKNMGEAINTEYIENCPTISPDGRYFFFQRFNGINKSETYWVSARIIQGLKPAELR